MKAVILAAGRGTRLEPLTTDKPKCLVPVGGIALIDRMIQRLGEVGIDDVCVVGGHKFDVLEAHLAASDHTLAKNAYVVMNEKYAEWGNFNSLLVAQDFVWDNNFIKLDGDVLLGPGILPALLKADGPAVLTIDRKPDLGKEEMKAAVDADGRIVEVNKTMHPENAFGESIGVERIDNALLPTLFTELRAMIDEGETDDYYERAYQRLMQQGNAFNYVDVTDMLWCEIDDAADLERANSLIDSADA